MKFPYTIVPLGDQALLIDFGNRMSRELNSFIISLFHKLKKLEVSGFIDVIPAYASLTVYYDIEKFFTSGKLAFDTAKEVVVSEVDVLQNNFLPNPTHRRLEIPVCYSTQYGPDLKELAQLKKLTTEDVIHLHTGKIYYVYMIGFLPGFAYMGEVDERIEAARHTSPRMEVPTGSVGIAGLQTGIYPLTSPGGWQIIGRTPLNIFDIDKDEPVLFQPCDEVKFYSITEDEFTNYKNRVA